MKRKSLRLKDLEKDRERITELLQQTQIQLYRLDGALGYLNDNIKTLKEEGREDDR